MISFDKKQNIVKNFEIINKTGREAVIKRAMSMQLDLPRRNFTLNHFCGRWAEERTRVENAVSDGVFEIYSNLGTSSAEENPFVFDGCVFYGDYYMNVGLNFSGVWRDEFDCKLLILEEVET